MASNLGSSTGSNYQTFRQRYENTLVKLERLETKQGDLLGEIKRYERAIRKLKADNNAILASITAFAEEQEVQALADGTEGAEEYEFISEEEPFPGHIITFPDSEDESQTEGVVDSSTQPGDLKRKADGTELAASGFTAAVVAGTSSFAGSLTSSSFSAVGDTTKRKRARKLAKSFPVDEAGAIILPVTAGAGQTEVQVHSFGLIVYDREGFHTPRHLFPKGFLSKKEFPSFTNLGQKTVYVNRIVDIGIRDPVFEVSAEDMPSQLFTGSSASGAWKKVFDVLQAKQALTSKIHLSGPDLFGLSDPRVAKAIQELPDADKCLRYKMQNFDI